MLSVGPVVSVPAGGVAVLVTVTRRETLLVASAAVTVMLLIPITSGIPDITHPVPLIDEPSNAPMLFVQLTAGAPLPPVTVPESEMIAEVVVAGGTLTVRAIGRAVLVMLTVRETFPL